MQSDTSYPQAIEKAVEAFLCLPGVGRRSAERYVQYLLKIDSSSALQLSESLSQLSTGIKQCPITYAFIDSTEEFSSLYTDASRDKTTVAVVADPFDIYAIEKTNFKGTYHILGGLISPIDGITPHELHIPELIKRCADDNVKELIIATNATVEGETTSHYIAKQLESNDISITKLARGLPMGLDIEYADMVTLSRAFEGRQTI